MADIAKLTVLTKGATATMSAGTASFTVPLGGGKDSRAFLFFDNANTNVTVRAKIKAGDGELNALGDMNVDIAASMAAAIPMGESMRFKNRVATTAYANGGSVTVNLTDTADGALAAGTLANVKTVLIQGGAIQYNLPASGEEE